jgi:hypothetical protein
MLTVERLLNETSVHVAVVNGQLDFIVPTTGSYFVLFNYSYIYDIYSLRYTEVGQRPLVVR